MYTSQRRRWALAAMVVAVGAGSLTACSKGGGPSNTGTADTGASIPQAVLANITKYSGPSTFAAPGPALDISSLKGKKIFDIPSVPNPFVQSISASMQAVAQQVGMKYTRFENQAQV